jgi:hypothetical protein
MANEALVENLALTMYLAAAIEDSNPDQRVGIAAVIQQLAPLYRAGKVQPEAYRRAVRKVLGPEWRPGAKWRQGFWADHIDG